MWPDESGEYIHTNAALGHARLSITDLSGESQPITNEDRSLWIVFNGEIFNYFALRSDLEARGHRFSTRSDTEVILLSLPLSAALALLCKGCKSAVDGSHGALQQGTYNPAGAFVSLPRGAPPGIRNPHQQNSDSCLHLLTFASKRGRRAISSYVS